MIWYMTEVSSFHQTVKIVYKPAAIINYEVRLCGRNLGSGILARNNNNNKIMRIMTNTQGVKKEYYGNFKAPYFLWRICSCLACLHRVPVMVASANGSLENFWEVGSARAQCYDVIHKKAKKKATLQNTEQARLYTLFSFLEGKRFSWNVQRNEKNVTDFARFLHAHSQDNQAMSTSFWPSPQVNSSTQLVYVNFLLFC